MDLFINESFAHKLLDKVTNMQIQKIKNFLKITGKYLSVFKISDNLCGQLAPFISPETYEEMIMPYHKRYIEEMKKTYRCKNSPSLPWKHKTSSAKADRSRL